MIVLEELDGHKSRPDDVGRNTRHVSRTLDEMRSTGNLGVGVALPSGGTLKIVALNSDIMGNMPNEFKATKVDNMIISFMLQLQKTLSTNDDGQIPILVSKDINVRLKCDALGIKCQDYLKMRAAETPEQLYRGVTVKEVPEAIVDSFYMNKSIDLKSCDELANTKFYPNQIVVIKNTCDGKTVKSALARYVGDTKPLLPIIKIESAFGLQPRNKEQAFALNLLFDDSVKLVTLTGVAGSGKTCLVLAAALEQLKGLGRGDDASYERLIVTRPVQPIGKDIGFLPGTLEEKMEPWIAPIRDNLSFLVNNSSGSKRHRDMKQDGNMRGSDAYLDLLVQHGLIEIEAITFIRGRSIPKAFMIIDEGQNLSMHELKTLLTRVGEGTKVVITGDLQRIKQP